MTKILVVDDEASIRTLMVYNLKNAGYEVVGAADGQEALVLTAKVVFDLIVLDWMLPEVDGLDVLRQLRQQGIESPVIFLTAKTDELDKLLGLELGADDYMTKPFSVRELLARIKVILRRVKKTAQVLPETSSLTLRFGQREWNQSNEFLWDTQTNTQIPLTKKEYDLLNFLVKNRHHTVTRDQILEAVWGLETVVQSRMIDIQISHLRDKLEEEPKNPRYLLTVRGFGYKLEVKDV